MLGVERNPMAVKLIRAAEELSAESSQEQVLERIVALAPRVVPTAEHASVTVTSGTGFVTAAASGQLARQIDAIQYEVDEGPCVAAARTGETFVVPNVDAEGRWPSFISRMRQQDRVRSLLAVPLRAGPEVLGSLNLSSPATWGFPAPARATGSLFAVLAGMALVAAVERERAADHVARARRLEEFTVALGHDLRSGITAALAAADVVGRRQAQLDPRGQQALDLLAGELDRQQRLLVDLLDLARAYATDLPTRPVALLPVVEEALHRHRSSVDLHAQPGAFAALVGIHPIRLARIVANLLDNADMHAGGATAVSTGGDGDRAWVAIEDAGPGVPPNQREHIFTRFRTTSSAPRQGQAALGLALSRQHARTVGGDLLVEDRPGGGACFRLLLPLIDAAGLAAADPTAAPPSRDPQDPSRGAS